MSFEKRGHHECHHIQKCSFHPIAKSDPIRDLNYISSQQAALITDLNNRVNVLETDVTNLDTRVSDLESITFPPSYATFWRNASTTLATGSIVNFDNLDFGPKTTDITINASGTTITIGTTGVYEISYKLLSSIVIPGGLTTYSYSNILRLYVGTTPYPVSTSSAIGSDIVPANNYNFDVLLSNTFQISLAAGNTISLHVETASPSPITPSNSNGFGKYANISIERIG